MSEVVLRMNYADAAFVEFALVDFVENAKKMVTQIQGKEGEVYAEERRTLLKIYENRLRNGKRMLGVVSAELNGTEVDTVSSNREESEDACD